MQKRKVVLGVASTRREIFSTEEAIRYKNLLLEKLKNFDVEIVDIEDINEEGLLFEEEHVAPVVKKFKDANVDGIFCPHTNFGTEYLVAKVAKQVGKPVLIWGPRDDAPLENGVRSRDTQCGLFATGKVLRRFHVPFTYLVNCSMEDSRFTEGLSDFLAVCAVVKAFRKIRILQISTRPAPFWTMIVNEGELLEKFGIEIVPLNMSELIGKVKQEKEVKGGYYAEAKEKLQRIDCSVFDKSDGLETVAALNSVIKKYCAELDCSAVCIQCWTQMQEEIGIMPCLSNGLLFEEGIPCVCETDIHGAISAIMVQEALLCTSPVFFADLTVRHPCNDNAELLWHCGNFPYTLAKKPDEAKADRHFVFPTHKPGTADWELKKGDITVCRFDGDNGNYSLFLGEGKAVDGPKTLGTYVWLETPDWEAWEHKLVTGPYVHHCACVYGKISAVLYEACKYIPGLTPDPVTPGKEEIEYYLIHGTPEKEDR
ncbi:L-fucose/L-arabinose isomerase family protein [Lachnotalea sp. AF33-28]|uniref:L-fucose/L-arabinose isomerase family protein n=1 Tax=Lachnotalea sp. AF33-28 TaxID=2292046 RepID=UPI000E533946|nr:L-fucose/L-arabinose isomerase family protein [Lachnotalea sp. AF33-28]RHP36382.1 fucose isomerase [Lachnotalea sp. AF33-28]